MTQDEQASLKTFSDLVFNEMTEMKKLGIFVPDRALENAKNLDYISDYENMKVFECVDLIISLSQLE